MYNVNVHFHQYCAPFPSNKYPKCQNWNFDKIRQKIEIMFVYLPNTSYFIHFQSVRQKKWNIHNKTNKYRWHFRSKSHQTTSLSFILVLVYFLYHNICYFAHFNVIFLSFQEVREEFVTVEDVYVTKDGQATIVTVKTIRLRVWSTKTG